jgi:hypothetical protein
MVINFKYKKMTKNLILQLFFSLLFCSIASCGQNPKAGASKAPVALGKIYQLPVEPDGIVLSTNPAMQKSMLNDYIMQMEWHFEMRFTDAERKTYEQIITDMWNSSERLRGNIKSWADNTQELRQKDLSTVNREFFSRQNSDIFDCGMEGLLNEWDPKSLRGIIKKAASKGDKECVFLWNKITEYEKPVAEGKIFISKFTQKYIDAAAEWMAYKINVVCNKQLIELDEEKREQMGKMIVAVWKKEQAEQKSEYEWGNVQAMLSSASTCWNYLRLTKQFSLDSYITNYNKLVTVADWAKEVVYYCPAAKPYAEQRIKELQDYAAKMSEAEWQLEFKRLNMQADMSKQVFQQMKNDMVRSHVLMLNIIEGDDKWEVKERKTY